MWLKYIISSAPQSLQKIFILIVGRLQKKVWPYEMISVSSLSLKDNCNIIISQYDREKNTLRRTVREKSKTHKYIQVFKGYQKNFKS